MSLVPHQKQIRKTKGGTNFDSDQAWCPLHNISYTRFRSAPANKQPLSGCPMCIRERKMNRVYGRSRQEMKLVA